MPARKPLLNTPGRRWRFRRNLSIFLSHKSGMSLRMLSDVFDLPRSRVSTIVDEIQEFSEVWKSASSGDDAPPEPVARYGGKTLRKTGPRKL